MNKNYQGQRTFNNFVAWEVCCLIKAVVRVHCIYRIQAVVHGCGNFTETSDGHSFALPLRLRYILPTKRFSSPSFANQKKKKKKKTPCGPFDQTRNLLLLMF